MNNETMLTHIAKSNRDDNKLYVIA